MPTWIEDKNGNKCSVEYFGTEESAKKALDSLEDCKNCTNCSRCSGCSRCYDCSGCSRCSGCYDCYDCSRCSGCSRCYDCSGCSGCSRCYDCSNVAFIYNKKNIKGNPDKNPEFTGAPPIPKIENIHQVIYEAVSKPKALDMGSWHTCETTHCRAGWVVHLAGEAGKRLEAFHDTPLAAQLIYRESGYLINPGSFYDDNKTAMADMKRLAKS